jgi:PII-like signaling protein
MKKYIGKRKLLRIYIGSEDSLDGKPLWEILLSKSKEIGLAGATVYKAIAGIGAHSELHSFNIWSLNQKLPLIIEIIDTKEKIDSFLDSIDEIIDEGLMIMSDVDVVSYKHTPKEEF